MADDLSAATVAQVAANQHALDTVFVQFSGYLVFFMQCGFAMLTAGSVRTKNVKNALMKNVLDAAVGGVAYYVFGYAFAFGSPSNAFIGHGNFALSELPKSDYHFYFFQYTFGATATTIVSGSVAERTSFYAYLSYAFLLTGFVYPVVAHWVWSDSGWLGQNGALADGLPLFGQGAIDFAGCIVVHIVGGFGGLIGAAVVGQRIGRFDGNGNVLPLPGHSATLCALGALILWFSWYGFNPGSALAAVRSVAADPVRLSSGALVFPNPSVTLQVAAVATTISASTAGLTTLVIVRSLDGVNDLLATLNGILAGLVSITSCAGLVEPYAAMCIGAVGAAVYVFAARIILRFGVDDPLEAFPIHGCCGLLGALCTGLFAREELQAIAGYNVRSWGAFYGGGGRLFACNLVGSIVVIAWVAAILAPFFVTLRHFKVLRILPEEEIIGNDLEKHGGYAYPEDVAGEEMPARKSQDPASVHEFELNKIDEFSDTEDDVSAGKAGE